MPTTNITKETPTLGLKFGGIKFIDFTDNDEAKRLYNKLNLDEKANMVKVINAYNGRFYNWWTDTYVTKEDAVSYILNYQAS